MDFAVAVDPIRLIEGHYRSAPHTRDMLVVHGQRVAHKAMAIARRLTGLRPNLEFIGEAAILHDIGIGLTRTPSLGCSGSHPYICHGVLGRRLLEKEGLPKHALVCERHVGVGLSKADIVFQRLPLPMRDMLPITIEEQIICYADKFFSKHTSNAPPEKPIDSIISQLAKYGPDQVNRFRGWLALFGP